MIQTCCATTVDVPSAIDMEGSNDKRRKPVFSLGRRSGRKGDPRMHRAVEARLADPNISLFHALRAGGFNYLDDIDAKAVDEENVTLAQRKNQLSRRLRMVKSTQVESPRKNPPGSQQKIDDLVEAQQASFQSLLRQTTEGSSIASVDSCSFSDRTATGLESHHDHEPMESSSVVVHHQQHHLQHTTNHLQHKPPQDQLLHQQQQQQAQQHYYQQQQEQKIGVVAAGLPTGGQPVKSTGNTFHSQIPGPPRLVSRMSSRSVNDTETGAPLCSEFGLRSLNRTAQSIGLTLDQLALVLSSTEDLATKLGINYDEGAHCL